MEGNFKLLLCEDDENLGLLLGEYLRARGYVTDHYPDGESGHKAFVKGKYDLCILDVMMPKKDGLAFAKEIRMVNPGIPVLFLTAKNMRDDVIEGFKSGADDYFQARSMDVYITKLRKLLKADPGVDIVNIHGKGYKLLAPEMQEKPESL